MSYCYSKFSEEKQTDISSSLISGRGSQIIHINSSTLIVQVVAQSSTIKPGILLKSFVLCVTTTR